MILLINVVSSTNQRHLPHWQLAVFSWFLPIAPSVLLLASSKAFAAASKYSHHRRSILCASSRRPLATKILAYSKWFNHSCSNITHNTGRSFAIDSSNKTWRHCKQTKNVAWTQKTESLIPHGTRKNQRVTRHFWHKIKIKTSIVCTSHLYTNLFATPTKTQNEKILKQFAFWFRLLADKFYILHHLPNYSVVRPGQRLLKQLPFLSFPYIALRRRPGISYKPTTVSSIENLKKKLVLPLPLSSCWLTALSITSRSRQE